MTAATDGVVAATAAVASAGQRRVVTCDPAADRRWDRFVQGQGDATVYQTSAWFGLVAHAYSSYRPAAMLCEDDRGQVTGVLPLVEKRGLLGGRRLSSLPHTPFAGPLAVDSVSRSALVHAAMERARTTGAWLQLKTSAADLSQDVPALVRTPWEETYVLDLPEDVSALRFGDSRNHSRIRWAVNKSQRCGVVVRPAEGEADLRAWYRLYLETMRWHVVPPRPLGFFLALHRRLAGDGTATLLLAEQRVGGRTTLLAGSLFLRSHGTVTYAFNGRRAAVLSLRPNDAIHWHAIHEAVSAGMRRYDFGEVDAANTGLAEFKSKWGATPRPLHRYHYPASREPESGVLRTDGPVRGGVDRCWRRLPLPATAALGAWAYGRL